MDNETQIGVITHYFGKIGVGVIKLTLGELSVGDTIRVEGHGTDFEQGIVSMQIEHQEVMHAAQGQDVGLKLDQPVKDGDKVFKISV